jgi:hypothetical protein
VTVLGVTAHWRVQILPSGPVAYKGARTLDFTREYRESIAAAFKAGALDVVPFTLGDTYAGDPEALAGEVRGLEVVDDGMDAVIGVGQRADAAIRASLAPGSPPLGAAPGLMENYRTSGGEAYPVVLRHVLGTARPMLTGLRGWREVEAAP